MKLVKVVLLFAGLGLDAETRQPKTADFPVEFVVQSASMSDKVVDMTLEICQLPRGEVCTGRSGRALYYVTSVTAPWSGRCCYIFRPGTQISGRFRVRQQIEIILTDDKGKVRTGWYRIAKTELE